MIAREKLDLLKAKWASAIRRAVILGSAEQPPETILIHDLTTGTQHIQPLETFVRAVTQGDSPWPI